MIKYLDNFYIRYIVNFFFFMLQPKYWIQVRETSLAWDKVLWESLRTKEFSPFVYSDGTCFVVRFEGSEKTVWVENFPCAFGRVYNRQVGDKYDEFIPLSITRWYFKKLLQQKITTISKEGRKDYFTNL